MSVQTTQLKRVSSRIAPYVKAFCKQRVGQNFYGSELWEFVNTLVWPVAPGSPERVLRKLRQKGEVDYTIISRGGSVYHVSRVTT